METRTVEVPEEILQLLEASRLGERPDADRVKIALAIHLFQEGVVSIGRAAELAGEPRVAFERLLVEMGIPTVYYDVADYEQDLRGLAEADRHDQAS
jgi:predicted HTH domain antitoxin